MYELRADGSAKQLVAPGLVGGANGLAVSPDGARIYVAHSTGIAVVDAASGALTRVRNTTRENISAIDGLYEYHGELIGVENVTNPGRVVLISLSSDGTEVTRVRTLLSHHHNRLAEPTTGAIRADIGYFYLLAASGVAHYQPDGTIDHPDQVPAPVVLKILLPR